MSTPDSSIPHPIPFGRLIRLAPAFADEFLAVERKQKPVEHAITDSASHSDWLYSGRGSAGGHEALAPMAEAARAVSLTAEEMGLGHLAVQQLCLRLLHACREGSAGRLVGPPAEAESLLA